MQDTNTTEPRRYDAGDRQALKIIQAIRSLTTDLEGRRAELARSSRTIKAAALRKRLTNDIDRLANLVDLADTLPRNTLHPHTRNTLDSTLDSLRRNLARTGRALAMERVRALRNIAETLARRKEVPMGKSHLVRPQFMRCVSYLTVLVDALAAEDQEDLKTTAAAINDLIAAERARGLICSFAGDLDLPPIDLSRLKFPLLPQEQAAEEGQSDDAFLASLQSLPSAAGSAA